MPRGRRLSESPRPWPIGPNRIRGPRRDTRPASLAGTARSTATRPCHTAARVPWPVNPYALLQRYNG